MPKSAKLTAKAERRKRRKAAKAALRRLRLSASPVMPDFLPIAQSCVPFLRVEVAARLSTALVQVWHHGRKLHQSSAEPGMRHLGAGRYTKRPKPNRMAATCPSRSCPRKFI